MARRHIPNGPALLRARGERRGAALAGLLALQDSFSTINAPAQRALGITVDNGEAFLGGSNDGIKRKIFIAFDSPTRGQKSLSWLKFPRAGRGWRLTGGLGQSHSLCLRG